MKRTLGGRLKDEISKLPSEGKRRGIGLFIEKMKGLAGEDYAFQGLTYQSISTYLNGSAEPSLSFLKAAAQVLGINVAYLVFGVGPRSSVEEAQHRDREMKGELLTERLESDSTAIDAIIPLDWEGLTGDVDPDRRERAEITFARRRALLRFGAKLRDAGTPLTLTGWDRGREELIRIAGEFLMKVDELLERIVLTSDVPAEKWGNVADVIELGSLGQGGDAQWNDQVLGLLAVRISGMGRPMTIQAYAARYAEDGGADKEA